MMTIDSPIARAQGGVQFRLMTLMEFVTICAVLFALSAATGIVPSIFLVAMALALATRRIGMTWITAALATYLTASVVLGQVLADEPVEVCYLAFQVFTGAPDPTVAIGGSGIHPLGPLPARPELAAFVEDVIGRIGTLGKGPTQLAVIFGPLAFDHSEAELERFIDMAFAIGLKHEIAVGFHIDDSMFWARRDDLWRNRENIEWLDWEGTPNTGRRIDWGPQPQKLPPQMCFNSKVIQSEVQRRATHVFGKAIWAGIERLKQQGKKRLFAGVIAGWETHIGQDFDTGHYLGYHALINRGFSKNNPPPDMNGELEQVVQQFISLWTQGLADAGLPSQQDLLSHRVCITTGFRSGPTSIVVLFPDQSFCATLGRLWNVPPSGVQHLSATGPVRADIR